MLLEISGCLVWKQNYLVAWLRATFCIKKNAMLLSQNACRIQLFQLTSQSKHGPVAVLAFLGFFKFSPKSNPTSWTLWTEKPKTWNHVPSWFPSCSLSWPISLDFRRKTPTDTRMHHASFIYASNPAAMPIEHITTHQQIWHARITKGIYVCVCVLKCILNVDVCMWSVLSSNYLAAEDKVNCHSYYQNKLHPQWSWPRRMDCVEERPLHSNSGLLLHGKNSSHMSPHQRLANEYCVWGHLHNVEVLCTPKAPSW